MRRDQCNLNDIVAYEYGDQTFFGRVTELKRRGPAWMSPVPYLGRYHLVKWTELRHLNALELLALEAT